MVAVALLASEAISTIENVPIAIDSRVNAERNLCARMTVQPTRRNSQNIMRIDRSAPSAPARNSLRWLSGGLIITCSPSLIPLVISTSRSLRAPRTTTCSLVRGTLPLPSGEGTIRCTRLLPFSVTTASMGNTSTPGFFSIRMRTSAVIPGLMADRS